MTRIGSYEAKTRFSELIARAEKGEEFEITKNGRPVARICPGARDDRTEAREAAKRIIESRKRLEAREDIPKISWEELKAELEAEEDERMDRWIK